MKENNNRLHIVKSNAWPSESPKAIPEHSTVGTRERVFSKNPNLWREEESRKIMKDNVEYQKVDVRREDVTESSIREIGAKSDIHCILGDSNIKINPGEIYFRPVDPSDITEIEKLHSEWFPINYESDYFSTSIGSNKSNYITIGAYWKFRKVEYVVGIMLTRLQRDQLSCDLLENISKCKKFCRYLNCFHEEPCVAYIMTIGVIDEIRRSGLGTRLLYELNYYLRSYYSNICRAIILHVVSYNKVAINFYIKNHFLHLGSLTDYYNLEGQKYDALLLGILLHPLQLNYVIRTLKQLRKRTQPKTKNKNKKTKNLIHNFKPDILLPLELYKRNEKSE